MKVNIGDVVRIDWQDHYSNSSGWRSLAEAKDKMLAPIIPSSVGVVVDQDKNSICIAQNWHPTDEGSHRVADFMTIIKGCIKKITIFSKGKF